MDNLHNFITVFGDEEVRSVKDFWQAYSTRRSLIDFGADTNTGRYPRYGYNLSRQTYYYINRSGRRIVVPNSSIKLEVERYAHNLCDIQRGLATKLINGRISLQNFYEDSARVMKLGFMAVIHIARGSSLDMSQLEKQHWEEVMNFQLERLGSLAQRIERGEKPLDGSILNAACQMGEAANVLFENWKLWEAKLVGKRQGRRRTTFAENCHATEVRPGCRELARQGWRPIAEVVPIGDAACYGNCHCRLEFR
ncbi:MAG: hypothetical protein ABIO63_09270 [Casimicrobiaceae bacterium]